VPSPREVRTLLSAGTCPELNDAVSPATTSTPPSSTKDRIVAISEEEKLVVFIKRNTIR
jgi:hypothetical protein